MTDNQAERFKKLADENNWLRASLANSGGPCPYCALPKAEWSACANGFPGCPRADDAMLCPNVGASLEAEDRIKELEAQVEGTRRALHEIAEEWAGSECGVPVYAQEAYAIGLAKRMYELAVEAMKGQS